MPKRTLNTLFLILASPAAIAAERPSDESPRYVASKEIVLTFKFENDVKPDFMHLWVSRDGGENWTPAEIETTRADAAVYRAPEDGRYDLFAIAHNAAGASSEPPAAGSKPHVSIVVDTKPPTLQVRSAEIRSLADLERKLAATVTVFDENMGDAGVRLFYRTGSDSPWRDGGKVEVEDGKINWRLEDGLPKTLDIQIVATDLAGNWSKDLRAAVETTLIGPAQAAPIDPPSPLAVEVDAVGPLVVEHVKPVEIFRNEPDVDETRPREDPADAVGGSNPDAQKINQLRRLAERYMTGGQFALAETRLRDALAMDPDSPDLLVRRGSALYRLNRFDEAGADFSTALSKDADNIAALEGNALVDATLRRYPEARNSLARLLELQPNSAKTWVKFGDIEHSLGNSREAIAAWERSLETDGVSADVIQRARQRLKLFRRNGREPSGKK